MSRPKQPGGMVALAIINIVLGSFALLIGMCAGIVLIAAQDLLQNDPNMVAQQKFLRENLPGYDVMQVAGTLIMFLQGVVLLVTGIGLLNVRNWARVTAIWCAALSLVWTAVEAVYHFAFAAPVMERFLRANPLPGDAQVFVKIGTVFQVGVWVLFVAYAIILITMLSRPRVRDLYTGQVRHDEELERYQDEGDDWYEKRRRRDDESDYR
jgi:hypothetical protein